MDPTKQRIAIAESQGEVNVRHHPSGCCIASTGVTPDGRFWGSHGVPDYLNDLNAMHEVEARFTDSKARAEYAEELVTILNRDHHGEYRFVGASSFFILHATASQRAEAFLKVLGLWEENANCPPVGATEKQS